MAFSVFQEIDSIAEMLHQTRIMGDQKGCQPSLAVNRMDGLHDFGMRVAIQISGGFIEKEY